MDSRLLDFLARAEHVLARLEPMLPAQRPQLDWNTCMAARRLRDGRSGYLRPVQGSLALSLSD